MEVIELPIDFLREASWNVNQVDEAMMQKLRTSLRKYGLVQNLVVRKVSDGYEVLNGNHRLRLLRELDIKQVPCVVVDVDDAHDEWVITNMDPEKYKRLQSNLNKEETRLKSIRANMDPSRLSELEGINETLKLWHNRFPAVASSTEDNGGGVKILEQTKPTCKIYGFEDIELIESITSQTAKRQILDRLQLKLVVFSDRIEIRCEIPIEPDKSISVILPLGL